MGGQAIVSDKKPAVPSMSIITGKEIMQREVEPPKT
jgi:hypothetical protein